MPIDLTPPVLADRRMSRTANHAATVVVVGAGSAGMTTAWRLSAEPSTHVILIDAGADPGPAVPDSLRREMLLPPEYYWGYAEADTGAFLPRGKVLGGTSAANAAAAVRGHPRCFDAWGPGWTWEDCLPAFIGLESDRQFGSQPYHGDTGPIPITRYPTDGFDAEFNDAYMAMGHCAIEDHNKPDCLGFAPWPTNRVGDDRASTLLQLLPPLRTRSNVTILPRTQVRRVLIDGQTAVGVLVDTPNGPEVVESDSIVLAGGTFGSPEILFASGVGDADDLRAAEIDVVTDLPGLGRNLSDHPFLQMVVDVTDRDRYPRGAGHGTLLTFEPDLPGDHVGHLFAYQTAFFDPAASAAQASVTVAMMTPASRGRLVFGANGQAAVHLGHFTHPDDLRTGAALLAHAREVIAAVAARGLVTVPDHAWWTNPDADTRLRAQAASYHHPVGTCRMGTGADAVVGPDLRVHGVDGLYVADASVMPQLPRGTTNLATMMIGWRTADIVSSHLAPKSALIQEDSL